MSAQPIEEVERCECLNPLPEDAEDGKCDWCYEASQHEPHVFQWSGMGSTLWCVTCNSPLCELL